MLKQTSQKIRAAIARHIGQAGPPARLPPTPRPTSVTAPPAGFLTVLKPGERLCMLTENPSNRDRLAWLIDRLTPDQLQAIGVYPWVKGSDPCLDAVIDRAMAEHAEQLLEAARATA